MSKYTDLLDAQSDGLLHHWEMGETSGATIADLINGWDAEVFASDTLTSGEADATSVTTPAGRGRDLSVNWDGTYAGRTKIAVIRIGQAPTAPSFSAFTIRVRYYQRTKIYDTYNVMSPGIFLFGRDTANLVYLSAGGSTYFLGAGGSSDSFSDPFTDGQWHDIILTGDASGIDLYVNASLVSSMSGSSTFDIYDDTGTTDSCLIGADDASGGAEYDDETVLDGIIQDASIWNRKMTSTEVSSLNTDGTSEPLIADTSPVTYDAAFDITFPIEADFTVQVNPALASFDVSFPILPAFDAFQDWVSRLPPNELQEVYRLIITGAADGLPDLVIDRFSSWQATSQGGGRDTYLQAVIPAADQYLSDIEARQKGQIVIQKGYRLSSGSVQYDEIMRSAFDNLRPDRGQRALTITVSGYLKNKPTSKGSRTLTGIRSISTQNGKRRVRCAVDLFLKPGMTVTALEETFTADYINYFVSQSDKFCEVSER